MSETVAEKNHCFFIQYYKMTKPSDQVLGGERDLPLEVHNHVPDLSHVMAAKEVVTPTQTYSSLRSSSSMTQEL